MSLNDHVAAPVGRIFGIVDHSGKILASAGDAVQLVLTGDRLFHRPEQRAYDMFGLAGENHMADDRFIIHFLPPAFGLVELTVELDDFRTQDGYVVMRGFEFILGVGKFQFELLDFFSGGIQVAREDQIGSADGFEFLLKSERSDNDF